MGKIKHSKYKNTGILFEMLVRQLTSETLTSDKSIAIDIIKKYFGKKTELAKELHLYNSVIKEKFKSETKALTFLTEVQRAHAGLNKTLLKRQKYNLVKEISENFSFESLSNSRLDNYKVLASIYTLFEYKNSNNIKKLAECKNSVLDHMLLNERTESDKDNVLAEFKKQDKSSRLLTYEFLINKFNKKYTNLNENQKELLNKYITHVNDTESIKEYIKTKIPTIKKQLLEHSKNITDKVTKIKVERLSEMLCNVENMNVIKESHILSLLKYYELVSELNEVHK